MLLRGKKASDDTTDRAASLRYRYAFGGFFKNVGIRLYIHVYR